MIEVKASGPPHVLNVWLGISKDMLPINSVVGVSKGMLPVNSVVGDKQGHAPYK